MEDAARPAAPHSPAGTQESIGWLLRRYRLAAGFTQEELAERAGVSVRAISDLERGVKLTPRKDTVRLLVEALRLPAQDAAAFQAVAIAARTLSLVPPIDEQRAAEGGSGAGRPEPAAADARAVPSTPRHNLPAALSSFIGREQEQATVRQLLAEARLVTLTGSGGVGKTRLALQVAAGLLEAYPDGIWLVELAALADPGLVAQAVAAALGVREEPGRPLLATLSDVLRSKRTLLVLDNCEHLLAGCAVLAERLLRACPDLHILATSREGLAVVGETIYRVPSLGLPDPGQQQAMEALAHCEAVTLFVARAHAQRTEFALTAQNAAVVAEICRRLDGIPLALELAAARVASLPLAQIAARLEDCFHLLTGGPRLALPRQQTLRATLDWSHDLLSPAEQVLFRRLVVFAGGWTLEAAEAVCVGQGIEPWQVLELLAQLVHKSLVLLEERAGEGRYHLLETVRQYGQEQLQAAGEWAAVQDRHLAWWLALAEEAEPELTGPDMGTWLDRLEIEHDNLRAALGWARERGEGETRLRLAGALWRFWFYHGHLGEGLGWLEGALAGGGQGSLAARAKVLIGAGSVAYFQADYGRTRALFEEALTLGDKQASAYARYGLGRVAEDQGDEGQAAGLFEESLVLWREVGDTRHSAYALQSLGSTAYRRCEYGRAAALLDESLALMRAVEDPDGIASVLGQLGIVACEQGEYARAVTLCEEALAWYRRQAGPTGAAEMLNHLGNVAYLQGEHKRAAGLLRDALRLCRDTGFRALVTG